VLIASKSIWAVAIHEQGDDVWEMLWSEAQAWWERQTDPRPMVRMLRALSWDANPNRRTLRWLALMYAESVGQLADDPRAAECRLVTRRWLLGLASAEEMDAARSAAEDVPWGPDDATAWDAWRVSARVAARAAADAAVDETHEEAWSAAEDAVLDEGIDGLWGSVHRERASTLARATRAMLPPLREAVHPQDPRTYEANMDDVLARMRAGDLLEDE
jgi:hypothetical protein